MSQHTVFSEMLDEDADSSWLMTYADLMTLLLCLFVLMFSTSAMDVAKFKRALSAIQFSMGEKYPAASLMVAEVKVPLDKVAQGVGGNSFLDTVVFGEGEGERDGNAAQRAKGLYLAVQKFIKKRQLDEYIVALQSGESVTIRITGDILFTRDLAVLRTDARYLLDPIVELAATYKDFRVHIEGHMDDGPISNPKFASNWEFTAIKATTLLRYFVSNGIHPRRLTATGYGDLIPLLPNTSERNRLINRRVEFVLEKEKTN